VIRTGYELNVARAQLRVLQEEQNRLGLEESVLTNPGRIERLASALGMIRPTPDQLRVIPSDNSVATLRN
jgi:cell division protein FtsL